MLCGRLFISVSRFIVNYSNLSLLEWVDILLSSSYNKLNRRPVLVLKLSYSLHTHKIADFNLTGCLASFNDALVRQVYLMVRQVRHVHLKNILDHLYIDSSAMNDGIICRFNFTIFRLFLQTCIGNISSVLKHIT